MSEVIPPSSAPIPHGPRSNQRGSSDDEVGGGEVERLPITEAGQICYERVLPSQAHYYKVPKAPKNTGKAETSTVCHTPI